MADPSNALPRLKNARTGSANGNPEFTRRGQHVKGVGHLPQWWSGKRSLQTVGICEYRWPEVAVHHLVRSFLAKELLHLQRVMVVVNPVRKRLDCVDGALTTCITWAFDDAKD